MRFWDASALAPLFIQEPETDAIVELYYSDVQVTVWTFTELEIASAIARHERDRRIGSAVAQEMLRDLDEHARSWIVVLQLDAVKLRTRRMLRLHPLRAADALQLAAALVACEDRPTNAEFVTLDTRLAAAARREGFRVLPSAQEPAP